MATLKTVVANHDLLCGYSEDCGCLFIKTCCVTSGKAVVVNQDLLCGCSEDCGCLLIKTCCVIVNQDLLCDFW